MNRRTMLKTVALAATASSIPLPAFSQGFSSEPWHLKVADYILSHARPDGGYGWTDQEDSHLTPTFAAINCLRILGRPIPEKARLAAFVRTHHPAQLKKLEQEHRLFTYQQVQSLAHLREDVSAFHPLVRSWLKPVAYLKQYEQHGYPVFQSEMAQFLCRPLLGLPINDVPEPFIEYLDSRRRANGSFNNTPAADGDGHVLNTWWGLQALQILGRAAEKKDETIKWLRQCQLPGGGFTFAPAPEFGGVTDAAYTWAGVRALKLLGAEPADSAGCIRFLHSLVNPDHGCADRSGWLSNPLATYYVLDALVALKALDNPSVRKPQIVNRKSVLPSDLKLFSIQIEAPGQGSPSDAVQLAGDLKIHLWGAKNAKPEWITRAQSLADQQKVPVKFFVANEEHGNWLNIPGQGTYSHTSDIIAPAGSDFGAALTGPGAVTWSRFRSRRFAPLLQAGGRLIWQFGENEELTRMLLDESLTNGGYAAISTFHFGNPDFTNSEPFLQRWRGQIPYVALQDAHALESWWASDLLAGFRTVFLAAEPTWNAWLEALKNNWVAALRHDAASDFKTWIHSGSREVLDFVRAREPEWKWWRDPQTIERPWASLARLRNGDPFEAGAPEQGMTLRFRCWWDCTNHGVLKKQLVGLVRATFDGQPLETKIVEQKNPQGGLADHYHLAQLNQISPGPHRVTATLRLLATGQEVNKEFQIKSL